MVTPGERARHRSPWTDAEIETLRRSAERGETDAQVADRLGRLLSSVRGKARSLGLKFAEGPKSRKIWSMDELDTLRAMAADGRSVDEIADRLGRSLRGTRRKARLLGVVLAEGLKSRKFWSMDELETLRAMAADGRSVDEIAKRLGRPLSGVRDKAKSLGVILARGLKWGSVWSTNELDTLRAMAADDRSVDEIAKRLARSYSAVDFMWRKLGLPVRFVNKRLPAPRWTDAEVEILFRAAERGETALQVADRLDRSLCGVRKKAGQLGIKFAKGPKWRKFWSMDELETLRAMAADGRSVDEIAKRLDRPYEGVDEKRYKLGLPARFINGNHFQHELVERYMEGETRAKLAREFGISVSYVADLIRESMGSLKPRLSDEEKQIIEERRADGCTCACIGRRLFRSPCTVRNYVSSVGLRDIETIQDDAIADLHEHGLDVLQIGRKLELPRHAVLAALRRAKTAGGAVRPSDRNHSREEKPS